MVLVIASHDVMFCRVRVGLHALAVTTSMTASTSKHPHPRSRLTTPRVGRVAVTAIAAPSSTSQRARKRLNSATLPPSQRAHQRLRRPPPPPPAAAHPPQPLEAAATMPSNVVKPRDAGGRRQKPHPARPASRDELTTQSSRQPIHPRQQHQRSSSATVGKQPLQPAQQQQRHARDRSGDGLLTTPRWWPSRASLTAAKPHLTLP